MRKVKVLMLLMLGLMISLKLAPHLAQGGDYIIGVGDSINLLVFNWSEDKDFEKTVTVRPDGKISFPLIGEVTASGLTPLQLREVFTQKLSEYINNPEVTVDIKGLEDFKVYIFGNLAKSGPVGLKGNTNLLQLFSRLGTIPDNIDLKQSFLVRNNKKLDVDFYNLLKDGDLSQNKYLKPNDTIFFKDKPPAPPLPKVSPFENKIRVIGEVKNQGVFDYQEGMTVLDAILRAGGATPYARPSATLVTRRKGDKIEEIRVDLEAIYQGAIDQNIELVPGDIISVPESLF